MIWWIAVALAATGGLRQGDDGVVLDATPPAAWSMETGLCWNRPTQAWSNASPVRLGGDVCVLEEPSSVACFAATTGTLSWRGSTSMIDALPADEQGAARARLVEADAAAAELTKARAGYSRLLRAVRAGQATSEDLEAASRQVDTLKATVDASASLRMPADQGLIGYTAHTPVTDGERLYALFGNGVVSGWTAKGERLWTAAQPRPPEWMWGYEEGQSASLVFAGGLVIVPSGELTARDPLTGRVVWRGGPWPHFGSLAVVKVDGVELLVTPDGRLLRAKDGAVLREGMAEMWYVAPSVHGDQVVFLESRSDGMATEHGGIGMVAWQILDGQGGAKQQWRVTIDATQAFYTAPVVRDEALWAVTHAGVMYRFDADTGATTGKQRLEGLAPHKVYSSPMWVDGGLYVSAEPGITVRVDPGTLRGSVVGQLSTFRSTPYFDGQRLYVRTLDGLICVGE